MKKTFQEIMESLIPEINSGGGDCLYNLSVQGIRGVAFFLDDGQVAVLNLGGAARD